MKCFQQSILAIGILFLCCQKTVVEKDDGANGDLTGLKSRDGSTFLCDSQNPCPDSQFCFNGLCAAGCLNDGDCAANQYCDTNQAWCVNATVSSCPSTPCEQNQECVQGYCSVEETQPKQCQPSPDGSDGCSQYQICVEEMDADDKYYCHDFPPCPKEGDCPAGLVGAVCNDGLIPNKARICLTGLCQATANCPQNWSCVRWNSRDVLGLCSNGGMGMPCGSSADCTDGNTCQMNFCLPGGDDWDGGQQECTDGFEVDDEGNCLDINGDVVDASCCDWLN